MAEMEPRPVRARCWLIVERICRVWSANAVSVVWNSFARDLREESCVVQQNKIIKIKIKIN